MRKITRDEKNRTQFIKKIVYFIIVKVFTVILDTKRCKIDKYNQFYMYFECRLIPSNDINLATFKSSHIILIFLGC